MDASDLAGEVGELVSETPRLKGRAPSSALDKRKPPSCAGCCLVEVPGVASDSDEQFSYVDGSSPSVAFVSNIMVSNI